MKFRLLEMVENDFYYKGHIAKKGQFIGVDWNGDPIIVSDYINKFDMIPIYVFDHMRKVWDTKYYHTDSPLLPIDFIQRLWVKKFNMKLKVSTDICTRQCD